MFNPGRIIRLTAVACSLMLVGCGSDGSSDTQTVTGEPTAPAISALTDLAPVPAEPGDIVNGMILTRLDVVISSSTTMEQLNAALGVVGGSVVAARAGFPAITIAIPRQDGPDALMAMAELLKAQPGILAVLPGTAAAVAVAPGAPADAPDKIDHLQDAGFPAAWNARRAARGLCVNNKVSVIVADMYHRPNDTLYNDFATQVPGVTHLGTGSVDKADFDGYHGYDVLTTLAANLDATLPTGANPFPDCLDPRAVQIVGLTPLGTGIAIDLALAGTTGNTVLNASFSFNDQCDPSDDGSACTPQTLAAPRAFDRAVWGASQRALLQPVSGRLLVASAAGNQASDPIAVLYPGTGIASFNSSLNVAASADSAMSFVSNTDLWNPTQPCTQQPCFPSLTATPTELDALSLILADPLLAGARATNVMIIGSSDSTLNNPSDFSNTGADVHAVGENIPTLLGVPTNGTSFAAPQVAGLASYLWMLSPELRSQPVQNTMAAIKANAKVFPAGMIDAYATVLSLDEAALPTSATAPVRLAILDFSDDGKFDEVDLAAFMYAYTDSTTGKLLEPQNQDYSRFDLNGDGYTGGKRTTEFDLDRVGSTRHGKASYATVQQDISGTAVDFDEKAVTDLQILCYYAYSDLYGNGNPSEEAVRMRDDLVGTDRCVGARLSVTLPPAIQSSAPLSILVEIPDGNGGFAPAPNMFVTVTVSCGTANPAAGQTDTAGRFSTTVTADAGCGSVSVTVAVMTAEVEPPLSQKTVTTTVNTLRMDIVFPPEHNTYYAHNPRLNIAVQRSDGNGGFTPAGNILLSFAATCGSMYPASGRTTWDTGTFVAEVWNTYLACDSVSVTVTAQETSGGPILAQETVTTAITYFPVIAGNYRVTSRDNDSCETPVDASGTATVTQNEKTVTVTWSVDTLTTSNPTNCQSMLYNRFFPASGSFTGTLASDSVGRIFIVGIPGHCGTTPLPPWQIYLNVGISIPIPEVMCEKGYFSTSAHYIGP